MRKIDLMEISHFLEVTDYKSIIKPIEYIEKYLNLRGNYSKRILEIVEENDLSDHYDSILDMVEEAIKNNNHSIGFKEETLIKGDAICSNDSEMVGYDALEACCLPDRFSCKNELDFILEELADELEDCYEYNYMNAIDHMKNIAFKKGIINAAISERTGIAESTVSRILNNKRKIKDKEMAIKFCIGLDLDYEESREVLIKFGYTVDTEFKRDKIFKFCLERGHNIYDIEDVFSHFDEDGWL